MRSAVIMLLALTACDIPDEDEDEDEPPIQEVVCGCDAQPDPRPMPAPRPSPTPAFYEVHETTTPIDESGVITSITHCEAGDMLVSFGCSVDGATLTTAKPIAAPGTHVPVGYRCIGEGAHDGSVVQAFGVCEHGSGIDP